MKICILYILLYKSGKQWQGQGSFWDNDNKDNNEDNHTYGHKYNDKDNDKYDYKDNHKSMKYIFTNSALWARLVVELPCPFVWLCVPSRNTHVRRLKKVLVKGRIAYFGM